MSSSRNRLVVAALLSACGADPPATSAPGPSNIGARTVATVRGEPVRARVPAELSRDGERYRSFVLERVYQHEALARARADGLALSAAERAAAAARVPPRADVASLWRSTGMRYEDLVQQELDVALIQKLERREVFDRVRVDRPALRAEYERGEPLHGPRLYVTATRTDQPCAAASTPPASTTSARRDGHRLALADAAAPAFDFHFAADGGLRHAAPYRAGMDALALSPDDVAALGAWAVAAARPGAQRSLCAADVRWVAHVVGRAPPGPLSFDDAGEEVEARARAQLERRAFDAWVERVLADARPTIVDPHARAEAAVRR